LAGAPQSSQALALFHTYNHAGSLKPSNAEMLVAEIELPASIEILRQPDLDS
jgi:hypothetical protein